MNKKLIYIFIFYLVFSILHLFYVKKKVNYSKSKKKILLEKIENTKVLINQTRATKKLTLSEINIVNRQIKVSAKTY